MSLSSTMQSDIRTRTGMVLGGLCGAVGIAMAAVGAHADATGWVTTAADIMLFHAPAFVGLAALDRVRPMRLLPLAYILLGCGVLLFSGDLITHALAGFRLFPMAAPTGGFAMIAGWLVVTLSGLMRRPE